MTIIYMKYIFGNEEIINKKKILKHLSFYDTALTSLNRRTTG
jgi:hypothetical protein